MSAGDQSPSPSGEGLGWGMERVLAKRAAAMRRDPTEPEKRLWRHLSNRRLGGFKFRRQAVIGARIVDFFCPAIGLIVEVDGDTHDPVADQRRDAEAAVDGWVTVRVSNLDVMANCDGVLAQILDVACASPLRCAWRLPHPNPSPEGAGLQERRC